MAARAAWSNCTPDDAAAIESPGSIDCPGLAAFDRSDGFQLGLDFLRLVHLGLRAIGWRARRRQSITDLGSSRFWTFVVARCKKNRSS